MANHEHFAGSYPHSDGTTRVWCIDCHEDLGQVTSSGINEGSPCAPGRVVLPQRPCFWNEEAERQWFRQYVARLGGYVSDEARERAR